MQSNSKLFLLVLLFSYNQLLKPAEPGHDLALVEMKQANPHPNDLNLDEAQLEEGIEQLTPEQRRVNAAKAFIEMQKLLLLIIPPEKLEELNEKFTKNVGDLNRDRMPTAEELTILEESVKADIKEIEDLILLEADKTLLNKLNLAWITFRQNMSCKTFTKTGVYRVMASFDSLLMTYLFITHNITLAQAFATTTVDLVGKFFLYYAYERLWKAPWFNRLWKKMNCCKRKKHADIE
ncbi:MAG: DUF2061 domain-containing protein [Candidatus Babeliales bacterium]|nr:DUF2061 domain-containing protein [Candidatus Babeliales bacterium]